MLKTSRDLPPPGARARANCDREIVSAEEAMDRRSGKSGAFHGRGHAQLPPALQDPGGDRRAVQIRDARSPMALAEAVHRSRLPKSEKTRSQTRSAAALS